MLNVELMVQEGIHLPATINSSLLWNGRQNIENRVEIIAKRVQTYMKGKKEVTISELVDNLAQSPDIILRALKILKDKGLIKEN